ncbi:hypothetical protein K438DRAFT_1990534 [Mycena galopus ATCC 62051]|nr:hypothetical protein K438DRAFT_1990534 [Mycena galopus ATCC 62051]
MQIENHKAEARKREELERERHTDAATTDLRNIEFATHLDGSTARPSSVPSASEAEADMWADWERSGAAFSAGDDIEDRRLRHEQLRKDADSFGFWNPEAVARDLGFGNATVEGQILDEDEEDDFLSEIMRQAATQRAWRRVFSILLCIPDGVAYATFL